MKECKSSNEDLYARINDNYDILVTLDQNDWLFINNTRNWSAAFAI